MTNQGKRFETAFKTSVPSYALIYRLPDSAQSFDRSSKLRFSRKNPFDYLMWDSKRHILYALELKTVKGKSISFERRKDETAEIHYHQIAGLREWSKYDGIICGFVIEFRELEKTIFIDIKGFDTMANVISKKSFNINDLNTNGISYTVIPQQKKRINYSYDIDSLLNKQQGKQKANFGGSNEN